MVTGTPGAMRRASHAMAGFVRRTQPWETAVPGVPPRFAMPWMPIWPGSAGELLQHVRAAGERRWIIGRVARGGWRLWARGDPQTHTNGHHEQPHEASWDDKNPRFVRDHLQGVAAR